MFDTERIEPGVSGAGRADRLMVGLAEMAPGADLGRLLESLDTHRLSGHERVTVLQAWSRQLAHAQAGLHAMMALVSEAVSIESLWADEEDVFGLAASEIGAALAWTRRAAEFNLGFAQDLLDRYPLVWEALHRGELDLPRARVIVEQTSHLDPALAGEISAAALQRAHHQTTGQLRAWLHKALIAIGPDSARERYERALESRRVTTEPTEAGTANVFGLDLPTAESNAAMRRINRLARGLKTAGDSRTMDQIRADVFLDLLNGRSEPVSGGRGVVDIRVDLTTLAGLDDHPAEIPGWGPVIADIARHTVTEQSDAEWRFTVTDPLNGHVVHTGITRRRPTAAQRRRVESSNVTCVFPGCRMPAGGSDLDHRRAWSEGGATDDLNLAPLCRRDHRLKHSGWEMEMVSAGMFVWTSPFGHDYTVVAEPP